MKTLRLTFISLLLVAFISCSKEKPIPDSPATKASKDIKLQRFIWKGLNAYYFWQKDVPDLSDGRFSSQEQMNSFLEAYDKPKVLFEDLLYQRGTIDKWSWIEKDYSHLEQSLQGRLRTAQGGVKTTGMEFGLVAFRSDPAKIFGIVRYIVSGTSAAEKNDLKRGTVFTQVNGTPLTRSNYKGLLFPDNAPDSYTLGLADYNMGNPIANNKEVTLKKEDHAKNPVYIKKVFPVAGKKIGYLMYNNFFSSFNKQLNDAFADFKAQGVTDLIVDLRYNPGGSLQTAIYFAGMITGQFKGKLFLHNTWNEKVEKSVEGNADFGNNYFTDQINDGKTKESINSLNLPKVYFIVSNASASASEDLIVGLKPYINVKVIGGKTTGKYVGSVTLYDNPDKKYFSRNGGNLNPDHKWAMQPIVFKVDNIRGNSSKGGIKPDIPYPEFFGNLGVLGDKKERLLARAIADITGIIMLPKDFMATDVFNAQEIDNSMRYAPSNSRGAYIDSVPPLK